MLKRSMPEKTIEALFPSFVQNLRNQNINVEKHIEQFRRLEVQVVEYKKKIKELESLSYEEMSDREVLSEMKEYSILMSFNYDEMIQIRGEFPVTNYEWKILYYQFTKDKNK